MIHYVFDEKKATQAAALLIKLNGGSLNYMKLIKLLYLADRESLNRWNTPITKDKYFSMDKGPILSKVLDNINNAPRPDEQSYWHRFISGPSGYEISLMRDINTNSEIDELSERETTLLMEIFNKYKSHNQWEMVKICHEILPEWENPNGTSIPIHIENILRYLDKTDMQIEEIFEESQNLKYAQHLLGPC